MGQHTKPERSTTPKKQKIQYKGSKKQRFKENQILFFEPLTLRVFVLSFSLL
jgi:hypothetical protein